MYATAMVHPPQQATGLFRPCGALKLVGHCSCVQNGNCGERNHDVEPRDMEKDYDYSTFRVYLFCAATNSESDVVSI